jgi:hypothetical protein
MRFGTDLVFGFDSVQKGPDPLKAGKLVHWFPQSLPSQLALDKSKKDACIT